MNNLIREFRHGLRLGFLLGSSTTYIITKIYIYSNYTLTVILPNKSDYPL